MREVDGDNSSEVLLRFPARGQELFGILTEPRETPRGIGIIYLNGMWDRNRFSVKLGRRLASAGFHVLRFDYHGVGESTGTAEKWNLERPFTLDLAGAVEELYRRGLDQFVFVGRCFGARTAMAAVGKVPGLRGLALLSMPVADEKEGEGPASRWALDQVQEFVRGGVRPRVLLRVFRPTTRRRYVRLLRHSLRQAWERLRPRRVKSDKEAIDWVSAELLESLSAAVSRRLPLLFLFGERENQYRDFRQSRAGRIGTLLVQAGDTAQVWTVDGPVHNLTSIQTQEAVLNALQEWVESLAPAGAASSRIGT